MNNRYKSALECIEASLKRISTISPTNPLLAIRQVILTDSVSKSIAAIQLPIENNLSSSIKIVLDQIRSLDVSTSNVQSTIAFNFNLVQTLEQLNDATNRLRDVIDNQPRKNVIQEIASLSLVNPSLTQTDVAKMLLVSISAQSKILNFYNHPIGNLLSCNKSFSSAVSKSLNSLTNSYQLVIDAALASKLSKSTTLLISDYIPIAYYYAIDVAQSITVPDEGNDHGLIEGYISDDVPILLDELLLSLDHRLIKLLEGARKSLHSDNPDRVRHVTVSLRELCTHVVRYLAPDQAIREWSSEPGYYDKGNPTRRARLLFIVRNQNSCQIPNFTENYVKYALSLITALNSGSHSIEPETSSVQLQKLMRNIEVLLIFLIQVSRP
jgi:hypothetical protein